MSVTVPPGPARAVSAGASAYGEQGNDRIKSDREIRIGGAAVVFAIGAIDMADEVYRYVVVTQAFPSGDCRVTTVRWLIDTDELEDEGKLIEAHGWPTDARQQAMSWALELAGYNRMVGYPADEREI